jgi:MoaD family protein
MRIKVRGYLTLRDVVGGDPFRIVDAEQLTVEGLLDHLSRELGEPFVQTVFATDPPGGLSPYTSVLVNGRHCRHLPGGLQTELAHGDEVSIFPPMVGG